MKNILLKEFKLFRLFGIDFKISTLLPIFILLFFPWSGTYDEILNFSIIVICILESVILHELGHYLASLRYNIKGEKIILNILGGTFHIKDTFKYEMLNPLKKAWINIMGVLFNLVVSIICVITIYLLFDINSDNLDMLVTDSILFKYLFYMIGINLLLFIFNILPIFPLDGGKLVDNILEHYNIKNHLKITYMISIITCALLIFILFILGLYILLIMDIVFIAMLIYKYKTFDSNEQ